MHAGLFHSHSPPARLSQVSRSYDWKLWTVDLKEGAAYLPE